MSITLKLTNTLTRQKEDFIPLTPGKVGMYVCGVTPYDDAHIGHARAYVVFDTLYRTLRHIYGETNVTYVRNFTDIDDKIIQRAAENGEEPLALANRFIASFHEDMDALNILRPTLEPRVSTSMPGIVKMVDELIEKGFAYVTLSGDVMYRTQKFPKFGALARRKIEEQQHGARVAVDVEKEAASDFVLWKANAKSATKMEQAFNPTDYGAKHFAEPGRPGWHIECSVMSREALGLPFDIHGGGEDLIFPHHCCEIAQSEALMTPGQDMARTWVHNSFITVNGQKMSKSLGNFTTIKDALKKYSPEAIRLWLLQTHYRKPVDFSDEALQAAENRMRKIRNFVEAAPHYTQKLQSRLSDSFIDSLLDDLNTPKALSDVSDKFSYISEKIDQWWNWKESTQAKWVGGKEDQLVWDVFGMLDFLGILPTKNILGWVEKEEIDKLLEQRQAARTAKNWAESDRLRDVLKNEHGILVEDNKDGTTTWRRL